MFLHLEILDIVQLSFSNHVKNYCSNA